MENLKIPVTVSIIIPVYNSEKYIQACINSCIQQTYQNLEIIVVNDGSTDQSEGVILTIDDPRLIYIKILNGGAAEARNAGLKIASGKLIQFLDSDDMLEREKINAQVLMYQLHGDDFLYSANMGTVSGDIRIKDEGYELYEKDFTAQEYYETLLRQFGKYMTTGVWLVPKKLIDGTYGWDKLAGFNDDGEYIMRIILQSKGIKFCKAALFYYRRDVPDSLSKSLTSKNVYSTWLYSYSSYVSNFKKTFELPVASELGWMALSVYYTESYPHHPELLTECLRQMKALGFKKPYAHGGALFVKVAKVVGVFNALRIWRIKSKIS
jgi:glycosyltransferase involved in cell wall biosynthesis